MVGREFRRCSKAWAAECHSNTVAQTRSGDVFRHRDKGKSPRARTTSPSLRILIESNQGSSFIDARDYADLDKGLLQRERRT